MRSGSGREQRGKKRGGKPLDADVVVDAAFAVLRESGLEDLTVRRIAAKLGVANPALYWHFASKQKIIDAMAARMIARAAVAPKSREPWDRFLARWGKSFRAEMRAHRDGARVIAAADLGQSAMAASLEMALTFFVGFGFTPRDAAVGIIAVTEYTLGATFEQQADPSTAYRRCDAPASTSSPLQRALARLDEDGVFDAGLSLLVEGLRAKLR